MQFRKFRDRRRSAIGLCLVVLYVAWQSRSGEGDDPAGAGSAVHARSEPVSTDRFGRLPLYFIENQGQVDPSVRYHVHQSGSSTFFTDEGVAFSMVGQDESGASRRWDAKLRFVDPHSATRLVADEPRAAVVSYFRGAPDEWRPGVATYGRLTYHELWPGIDLVYEGSHGRLKYTLRVRPGADPRRIRLAYDGVDGVSIDDEGRLVVTTGIGSFLDETPTAFQQSATGGRDVDVRFVLGERAGEYGFDVGDYDPSQTLIIDPIVLLYSGFIGGGGNDIILALAIDGGGNAYVAGSTTSLDFPVTVGPDLTFDTSGARDAFVLKLDPSGTSLVYAGYLGGDGHEWAYGVDVDANGAAYVVGETLSPNFPTIAWPHASGPQGSSDAFVAKVAPSGLNLVFSGYMGGASSDAARDIAVDAANGEAYISGLTSSSEVSFLPTPSNTFTGLTDAFVVKLDAFGGLRYAPFYIGTPGSDAGWGVDFDRGSGDAIVTGVADVGLPAPVNPHAGGAAADAFVARVDNVGSGLVWTTYVGGTSTDQARDIAVDASGIIYIAGQTASNDLPATGPQTVFGGGSSDALVAKLDSVGGVAYLTYLGGALSEDGQGIDADALGNAYVTGSTSSTELSAPPFPIVAPGQLGATHAGASDAFITKVDATGTAFLYSAFHGSSGVDVGYSVASDGGNGVFFGGVTDGDAATLLPTKSSSFASSGGSEAFAARITAAPATYYRSIGTAGSSVAVVAVVNGSKTVTGSATSWLVDNRGAGDVIDIAGVLYIVESVESDTSLTLHRPYGGTTGSGIPATIARAFSNLLDWERCIGNSGPCPGPPTVFSNSLAVDDRNEVGVVYFDGSAVAGGVDINGPITDTEHRITLTGARRNRHQGVASSGALIDNFGNGSPAIRVQADHVTIEWLELKGGTGGAHGIDIAPLNVGSEIAIHHMLIHHLGASSTGIRISTSDIRGSIYNNIVYVAQRGIDQSVGLNSGSAVEILNNTVFGASADGIRVSFTLPVVTVSNNIAHSSFPDFNVGPLDPVSSNNLSSDGTSPGPSSLTGVSLAAVAFVSSTAPEDFHIVSGLSAAENAGVDLPGKFTTDIDGLGRVSQWDIGADEAATTNAGASLSSANDQTFIVGALPTPAATITVVDLSGGSITLGNDIRIRIPSGFEMLWDPLATPTFTGAGAIKVGSLLPFEDGGKTLVIDVTTSFTAGDDLVINGLGFEGFFAPSPPSTLELDLIASGGSTIAAADDHTIEIIPASTPQIQSDVDQFFEVLQPDVLIAPILVTDAATPTITAANDIRITIPPAFNMAWSPVVSSYMVSGPGSFKVNGAAASVSFEDAFRTVVIDVTTDFSAGETVVLSGLFFSGFGAPSAPDHLRLEVFNDGVTNDTDGRIIVIDEIRDIPVFTVRSADSENLLQWMTPASGYYAATRIVRRDDGVCPGDETDGIIVVNQNDGLGALGSFLDTGLTNDRVAPNAYYAYRAFVDAGGGRFSPVASAPCVTARPITVGPGDAIRWIFNMAASALATPGVGRASLGPRLVYVPSNDGSFYALVGGDGGGHWYPGFVPPQVNVVQHRPPVIPFGTGGSTRMTYLSSQDGHVYAVDADDGSIVWDKTVSGSALTGGPAGLFSGFGSSYNLIFVGTREGLPSGARFEALEVDNLGNTAWSFTNSSASPAQSGNDARIGPIQGGASVEYATNQIYFGSWDSGDAGSSTVWAIKFTGTASDDDVDLLWSRNIGNVSGTPVLHKGVVYVGNDNGDVYAFHKDTGAELWGAGNHVATGAGSVIQFIFPQFDSNNILFTTAGSPTTTWSVADNGGARVVNWSNNTLGVASTPLNVPYTPYIFLGSDARRLMKLATDNSFQTPLVVGEGSMGEQLGMPTYDGAQRMLYVGTDAGKIYAIDYDLFP